MSLAAAGATALTGAIATADESAAEKAQSQVDQTKTDSKRMVRKAKRKGRHATGNGSTLKDAQDKANDAGDQLGTDARKLKRKAD